jgi:recombinational DNA repair ATPase RecF
VTRLISFEVNRLAGKRKPYSQKLNDDVNVFFGGNGSGKTSLLKILHAALSNRSESVIAVPFDSATVVFHSSSQERRLTRTIDKRLKKTSPEKILPVEQLMLAPETEAEFSAQTYQYMLSMSLIQNSPK